MDDSVAFRRTGPFGHATTAGLLSKPRFELRIGSNIFRNTNGIVTIHGKEQLVVELKPELGRLLATLDLYNERGVRIAHLRRNVLTLNEGGRFAVDAPPGQPPSSAELSSVRLTDLQSKRVVLDVRMVSEYRVDLVGGELHSHKGMLVEITPHYCRISSHTTLFGEITETRGGPAVLG